MQTNFERNMTKKAADPDDMEVSCWSPMDVSYGYIETVGGFKFYSMTNWLINLTLGRVHPGFESFMLGLDEISYSLHFYRMFMHNPSTYYERGSQFAGRVKLRFMADFDEAQRNGLVISCGRLWLVVVKGLLGDPTGSDEERRHGQYILEFLEGCFFHWMQSVKKQNAVKRARACDKASKV